MGGNKNMMQYNKQYLNGTECYSEPKVRIKTISRPFLFILVTVLLLCVFSAGVNATACPSELVGYWTLDENATTVTDSSTSGINGHLGNTTAKPLSKGGANCKASGCYYFDGGDLITMGNKYNFERTDDFSISAWVKTTSTSTSVVSKMDTASDYRGYDYYLNSAGKTTIYMVNGYAGGKYIRDTNTNTVITDDSWHHIVLTKTISSSATGISTYIDGVNKSYTVESNTLSATMLGTASFLLGARGNKTGERITGTIDEVMVYNKTLSPTEISDLYSGITCSIDTPISWNQTLSNKTYEYPLPLNLSFDINASGNPLPVYTTNRTNLFNYNSANGKFWNKTWLGGGWLGTVFYKVYAGNTVNNITMFLKTTVQDTKDPHTTNTVNDTVIGCGQHSNAVIGFYDEHSLANMNWNITNSTGAIIYTGSGNTMQWINYTQFATYTPLGGGTWDVTISARDNSSNSNLSNVAITVQALCDVWNPLFNQTITNKTISTGTPISIKLNTTDAPPVKSFPVTCSINDTTHFEIDSSSCLLTNKTLPVGTWFLKINATDNSTAKVNSAFQFFKVVVSAIPLVEGNLSLLVTNSTLYEAVNTWFNITGTVTCGDGDVCADTNLTLTYDLADCELYLGYNASYWIGNLTVGNSEKRTWKAKCTVAGYYNFTINATDTQNYLDNRTQIYFVSGGGGGLTIQEHNWLQAIYNEVGNMNLTIIYVFFLVVSTVFLGMYAFKRDKPREEGSRGFILGTIAWFFFLALTFISFHLELAWLRMPSAWLFGGISLIIGISLFVDVWASWKKI